MASVMDCGNELALAALVECTAAAVVIPAAWPCVEMMATNQCDPGAIYDRGMQWLHLATDLGHAADALRNTAGRLSADSWTGDDRTPFDHKVGDEQNQLEVTRAFATVVGVCLIAVSIAMFALVVVMFVVATILAALAAAIVAVMAGVVTAPGAVMLEFEADIFAADAAAALEAADGAASVVANSCAAAVGAAMAGEYGGQLLNGNANIGREAVGAGASGMDDLIWGALSRLEQKTTAQLAGRGNPTAALFGVADTQTSSGQPVLTEHARDWWDRQQQGNR